MSGGLPDVRRDGWAQHGGSLKPVDKGHPNMYRKLESTHRYKRPLTCRPVCPSSRGTWPRYIDTDRLSDHVDALYRTARSICESHQDAEDLVQETFANVLKRPRLLRTGSEIGYLRRALKNTYASHHRAVAHRPATRQLFEHDAPALLVGTADSREILEAIAGTPAVYRRAVITVDLLGLSYREAAHALDTSEATLTTRLHRGRQCVASQLVDETGSAR